jgi:hypothetical protein
LQSQIHELINSVGNKEELPLGRRIVVIIPIYKKGNKTVVVIVGCHYYQLHTKCYLTTFSKILSPYVGEITGDGQCGFQHNINY